MGGPLEWKARSGTTEGRLTAVENVIAPGAGPMEPEQVGALAAAAGMEVRGPPLARSRT